MRRAREETENNQVELHSMKTVLTFGVYDMLHIGHMLLFERARKLGDKLVVAVQDESQVLKYKPDTRMIYTTEERVYMVDSIKSVDKVVVYKDVDTDIQEIEFDILVIGEDQRHEGFQRAVKWCEYNGKEVVTLTRTEGKSSTILRLYSKSK